MRIKLFDGLFGNPEDRKYVRTQLGWGEAPPLVTPSPPPPPRSTTIKIAVAVGVVAAIVFGVLIFQLSKDKPGEEQARQACQIVQNDYSSGVSYQAQALIDEAYRANDNEYGKLYFAKIDLAGGLAESYGLDLPDHTRSSVIAECSRLGLL